MAENKMERYCKLPIPIKAYKTDKEIDIETLEGTMHASVGDYIITGVNGESYPCKPDIFEKTYIKYGQANKMAAVAQMFGKKLDAEFMARLKVGFEINCKFTSEGLKQEIVDGDWYDNDNFLRRLLTGESEIVDD